MTSAEDIAKNIRFDNTNIQNVVSYSILNNANGDSSKEIKVIFNGGDKPYTTRLKKGNWKILAEDGNIDPEGLRDFNGGSISIPPCSALILTR